MTDTDKTERERFEAWYLDGEVRDLGWRPNGYPMTGVHLAWEGWQARAALDMGAVPNEAAIVEILRKHIKVDATGLAPAVVSHYLFGFEDAAAAIVSAAPQPPASTVVDHEQQSVSSNDACVSQANDNPDFVATLQGYASMCESAARGDGLSPDDCEMVVEKLRDAAFVIDALQKLRDEKISLGWKLVPASAAMDPAPPAQAVAADDPEWLARASGSIADMVADWGRGPAPDDGPPADLIARRLARFSPPAQPAPVACIACEDHPRVPNDPCAVCGKTSAPPNTYRQGAEEMPAAWHDVLAERRRQVSVEEWTPDHDDEYESGELALAAAAYAENTASGYDGETCGEDPPYAWPWADKWWKPTTRRRDLVKAGALILAEIERLDRAIALPRNKEG